MSKKSHLSQNSHKFSMEEMEILYRSERWFAVPITHELVYAKDEVQRCPMCQTLTHGGHCYCCKHDL